MQEIDLAGKTIVRVSTDRRTIRLFFSDGTSIEIGSGGCSYCDPETDSLLSYHVGDKEVEVKSNGD